MDSVMIVHLILELKIIIKNVVLICVIIHKFLMRKEDVLNVSLILEYKLDKVAMTRVLQIHVQIDNMY